MRSGGGRPRVPHLDGTGHHPPPPAGGAPPEGRKRFELPSAVTILVIVLVLMWVVTLFLPSGTYQHDEHRHRADRAPRGLATAAEGEVSPEPMLMTIVVAASPRFRA